MTLTILQAKVIDPSHPHLGQLVADLDWLVTHAATLPGMDMATARDVVAASADLGQWVTDYLNKQSQQSREVMP